jgi:hypothetical protein
MYVCMYAQQFCSMYECMYVCIHLYSVTFEETPERTYIHTYIHTSMTAPSEIQHTHTLTHIHVYMHAYTHLEEEPLSRQEMCSFRDAAHTHTYMYICMHTLTSKKNLCDVKQCAPSEMQKPRQRFCMAILVHIPTKDTSPLTSLNVPLQTTIHACLVSEYVHDFWYRCAQRIQVRDDMSLNVPLRRHMCYCVSIQICLIV